MNSYEQIALQELERAAKNWNRSYGPFIPFAKKRISMAYADYQKAKRIGFSGYQGGYGRSRGKRTTLLDVDAIRKGCMMAT